MIHEWQTLIKMTGGKALIISRIEVPGGGISIEGEFALPPLARLSGDDQLFAAVFLKTHGSIKQMEKYFGISYPTVKNRLNRIAAQLDMVNVDVTVEVSGIDKTERLSVLEQLENGEISLEEALKILE
jgi:hypothetical protein